jgi:lipopolysaccharide/colanic/teichoic acid biosynthesis glycosyltransferase
MDLTVDVSNMMTLSRHSALTGAENLTSPPQVTCERARQPRCVPTRYFSWRQLWDRPLALVLLAVFSPLIAMLACWPGIFRQTRVGRQGRRFTMYKIRTMRRDAEARTGAVWSTKHDPRLTRFGRVLRHLHLDELPQLVNVVRGEMALVGPRPERPIFVEVLAQEIPGYVERLAVLPGITGLAQVNLPPDSDLDSVRRKLHLDREYITTGSFWLDVRLLLCTASRLIQLRLDRQLGVARELHRSPLGPDDSIAARWVGPDALTAPSDKRVNGKKRQLGEQGVRGKRRPYRLRVRPR